MDVWQMRGNVPEHGPPTQGFVVVSLLSEFLRSPDDASLREQGKREQKGGFVDWGFWGLRVRMRLIRVGLHG